MEADAGEELEAGMFRLRLRGFEGGFDRTLDEFFASREHWRYSHKIGGRWENVYVPVERVPSARPILSLAAAQASRLGGEHVVCGHGILEDSFWFNQMEAGDETRWHNHKSWATMSGVCYLQVPDGSGVFLYRTSEGEERALVPELGDVLLFPPSMNHAVAPGQNKRPRISLAFNLFTLPLEMGEGDPFEGHPKFG